MTTHYDAIVIGAGMGGLSAGLALARAGRSVVVLERRERPGGLAQSFTFDGGAFSSGLHALGGTSMGGSTRRLLEGLRVAKHLVMYELDADANDRVMVGDHVFDIPAGRDRYVESLVDAFPADAWRIRDYFHIIDDVAATVSEMGTDFGLRSVARAAAGSRRFLFWGARSLAPLIARTTQSPLLRAVLAARCGNHGLPPSRVPLAVHASMVAHFLGGAAYPGGGGGAIADAMVRELEAHGGELRLRSPARRMILDSRKVDCVELADGQLLRSRDVISDVHPRVTFSELLPADATREGRRRLPRAETSIAALGVFCTLDRDPSRLGLGPRNLWWYRHADVERIYRHMNRSLPSRQVDGLFFSSSSLKAPSDGAHTLEVSTLVPFGPFESWAHLAEGERGEAYESFAGYLADMVLDAAEVAVPGLRDAIRARTVATPLTYQHMAGAYRGSIYGTAKTIRQVGPFAFPVRTSVRNLHLVGASTLSHGVAGSMRSGIAAARGILGAARDEDMLAPPDGSLRVERPGRAPRPQPVASIH